MNPAELEQFGWNGYWRVEARIRESEREDVGNRSVGRMKPISAIHAVCWTLLFDFCVWVDLPLPEDFPHLPQ